MPKFCLLPEYVNKFKKAIVNREVDPFELSQKTSKERRAILEKYVGKDNAEQVNALFESKLLLKNQIAGYKSWVKRVSGISPQAKRDIISRIEGMDKILNPTEEKAFLQDLASQKLGVGISIEEAKNISDLSQKMVEARTKIPENVTVKDKSRLEYGTYQALLKNYVAGLKSEAKRIKFTQQPVRYLTNIPINAVSDLARTIQTAYDNSLWGRQLISALTNPRYTPIWTKRFLGSFKTMGKELLGKDAMLAIDADIYSRPNALNGKYAADPSGYGLGITTEEIYASQLPAKIPILGRLFKASEAAFNGGAKLVRADIADLEIRAAEKAGLNVLDKKVAQGLGSFVTSITGRGSAGPATGALGKLFYAPRFYTAEINQLTAHLFDPKATSYVRIKAAQNLATNLAVTTLATVLARQLDPNSVDPNKHLGQIKIWGNWVDITGGKAGFANLVWKMSDKALSYMQGNAPKYGEQTALDLLENFAEGKLNVVGGLLRDVLQGQMYGGKKVSVTEELKNQFTPFNLQTFNKMLEDPNSSNILGSTLLEFLGFSNKSNQAPKKDWSTNPTKAQSIFKSKVGDAKFTQANDEFNKAYDRWYQKMNNSQSYKNLSPDEKSGLNTKAKASLQDKIFKKYGFEYKQTKNKKKNDNLKNLLP